MKKILGIMIILLLMGCTGLNVSTTANLATDTAFVLALQNNPSYKAGAIIALQEIKVLLSSEMTYDQLIAAIASKFGSKYAVFGVIFAGYLAEDKPIFETYVNMLDSYKVEVIKKIDHFILLAGAV